MVGLGYRDVGFVILGTAHTRLRIAGVKRNQQRFQWAYRPRGISERSKQASAVISTIPNAKQNMSNKLMPSSSSSSITPTLLPIFTQPDHGIYPNLIRPNSLLLGDQHLANNIHTHPTRCRITSHHIAPHQSPSPHLTHPQNPLTKPPPSPSSSSSPL